MTDVTNDEARVAEIREFHTSCHQFGVDCYVCWLLDQRDRYKAAVDAVLGLHRPVDLPSGGGFTIYGQCDKCSDVGLPRYVSHPCPTVEAVTEALVGIELTREFDVTDDDADIILAALSAISASNRAVTVEQMQPSGDVREAVARAIRNVGIGPLGPNTIEIAQRGGDIYMTPDEAMRCADAALSATRPATVSAETHTEDTLLKVYRALERAGNYTVNPQDAVREMQNEGILFRERAAGIEVAKEAENEVD